MTSEAPTECFVYITLPGQTEPVTAGRFALATDRRGTPEGRFVYGRSYLERPNAVALDPIELKLSPRTYSTVALGGVFGALRDASPDYWGRRVIQRHLGKAQPGEMEYLLHSPDDRAGALGFGLNQTPPAPKRTFNRTLDLDKVQVITDAIMISALTLLRAEDNHQSRDKWSYVLLAEEIRRVFAEPAQNAAELFRRMCFNALISNIDDHPRNHALIAKESDWKLSPAYDLTPAVPVSMEHRDLAWLPAIHSPRC